MAKHHPIVGSAPVEATELELQDLFAQEVLQSERLRATILAWAFGAAAIYVTLNMFLVHVVDLPVVEAGFPFATIIIFLAGVTLYEIAARKFVVRRIKQGRDVQPWVWYANAFIEVSLPTLVLVFIGQTLGMVLARLSPVVLFYFAFIMLATLRLDFQLSLFTGTVAALEYLILALVTIGDALPIPNTAPIMWTPFFYIQKAVIIFGSGVVAAFVAREIRRRTIRSFRSKLLDAEHARKTKELEEARQLQLSMLPQQVPQLPHLEIAAYMKPATEVGGDYYDFHLSEDGTLTTIIGDATGHGLKSGTMVTATKSLFATLAHEQNLMQIFRQCNLTLKRMNLRGLYMAALIVKIKACNMAVVGAGMPPLLIFRSATQEIEEIALKGMPLGSVSEFPYQKQERTLFPGDVVVLMSDGFPERFNEKGEILDYEKAKAILGKVAHQSLSEIIGHFVEVGEAWAEGRAQDDDVTFVVLKVKDKTEEEL